MPVSCQGCSLHPPPSSLAPPAELIEAWEGAAGHLLPSSHPDNCASGGIRLSFICTLDTNLFLMKFQTEEGPQDS